MTSAFLVEYGEEANLENPMRNAPKSGENRNIRRVDYKHTRSWQVVFNMKGLPAINATCSDKKFGGKENALKFARRFRDALEQEFAASDRIFGARSTRGGFFDEGNSKGIYRTEEIDRNGIPKYIVWKASYFDKRGLRNHKNFALNKYGSEEAAHDAAKLFHESNMVEYREQKLREESQRIRKAQLEPSLDGVTLRAPVALFLPPPEAATKIWRYMDFTKFIWMLEKGGIFLPRMDKLNDPFEGSFSHANQELRPLVRKYLHLTNSLSARDIFEKLRNWVGASCWHVNNHESAGMWRLYAQTSESICIQSTYERLRDVIPDDARIGMVRYVDYQTTWIPESNPLAPFMFKRLSFQHEQELRILKPLGDLELLQAQQHIPQNLAEGEWLNCDLAQLIASVHVHPDSPAWFGDLVQMVANRYSNGTIRVMKSGLADSPLW